MNRAALLTSFMLFAFLYLMLTNHAPLLAADPYAQKRKAMIEHDIKGRGIKDKEVLKAMGKIPRQLFVDKRLMKRAYADHPLPIGDDPYSED